MAPVVMSVTIAEPLSSLSLQNRMQINPLQLIGRIHGAEAKTESWRLCEAALASYITTGCATSLGAGCDLGILMKNTVPSSEVRSTVIDPS